MKIHATGPGIEDSIPAHIKGDIDAKLLKFSK
jgi:hypothetical protein